MKNNSKDVVFCTALAALVVSMMLVPVGFAAIGVEVGDWAKYDIEAEIPEEIPMEEMEEMEWGKLEVKSVVDTTVTLEGTFHFKNGTEGTRTLDETEIIGFIIEADLGEGDEVIVPFTGGGMTMYINGTVSRTYAGASREVNYVDITVPEASVKAYWDKATGILCELSLSAGVPAEFSLSFKMTKTNMWEAEAASFITQWWFWAIIAVIIIAAAGSAVLLWQRRKAPLPEVAPAPTE